MKTATPQMARAINDRLALDLLLEHGTLTAPQLRALTGLSRPTVSDLVERLRVNGLITVVGESGEDRRGRTPASTASWPTAPTWPGSTYGATRST